MSSSALDTLEEELLHNNLTINESDLEHLLRCWSRQTCRRCLAADQCSWCPFVCETVAYSSGGFFF